MEVRHGGVVVGIDRVILVKRQDRRQSLPKTQRNMADGNTGEILTTTMNPISMPQGKDGDGDEPPPVPTMTDEARFAKASVKLRLKRRQQTSASSDVCTKSLSALNYLRNVSSQAPGPLLGPEVRR